MTPNTYLYFDYYQTKDTENEPLAIGGYVPLERVYGYEPMPSSLTPEEQNILLAYRLIFGRNTFLLSLRLSIWCCSVGLL